MKKVLVALIAVVMLCGVFALQSGAAAGVWGPFQQDGYGYLCFTPAKGYASTFRMCLYNSSQQMINGTAYVRIFTFNGNQWVQISALDVVSGNYVNLSQGNYGTCIVSIGRKTSASYWQVNAVSNCSVSAYVAQAPSTPAKPSTPSTPAQKGNCTLCGGSGKCSMCGGTCRVFNYPCFACSQGKCQGCGGTGNFKPQNGGGNGGGYIPSTPVSPRPQPQAPAPTKQPCRACNTSGSCPICHGSKMNPYLFGKERTPCNACEQSGKCLSCKGQGWK